MDRVRDARGRLIRGPSHTADGEIRWRGRKIAVELSLDYPPVRQLSKRGGPIFNMSARQYRRILAHYDRGIYDRVLWYAGPAPILSSLRRTVYQLDLEDLVSIRPLENQNISVFVDWYLNEMQRTLPRPFYSVLDSWTHQEELST
jgi:hypothetical protein